MTRHLSLIAASLAMLTIAAAPANAQMGTAFTYQGSLEDGGAPADGNYDMTFILWDAETGGATVGAPSALRYDSTTGLGTVAVVGGLFRVTLDFGVTAFDGNARWLGMAVRNEDPTDTAPYIPLTPRVALLPVPYAIRAESAAAADLATSVTNDAVDDADADPTNELQDLAAVLNQGNNAGGQQVNNVSFLGINTATPAHRVHVNGGSIRIDNPGTSPSGSNVNIHSTNSHPTISIVRGDGAGATLQTWRMRVNATSDFLLRDETASADRLTVNTAGNVGIGTESPTNQLSVAGSADFSGNVAIGQAANDNSLLRVAGPIREGSEASAVHDPGFGVSGFQGLVTRRFVADAVSTGFVIGRTPNIILEAKSGGGDNKGMQITWSAAAGQTWLAHGTAVTRTGTLVPIFNTGSMAAAGTAEIVAPGDSPAYVHLVVAEQNASVPGEFLEITAVRPTDSFVRWGGTLRSTFNQ